MRRINFPPGSTSTIPTSPVAFAMVPKPDSGEDDDSLDMQKVPLREADDDPEALVILGVKFNLNIQS